MIEFAAALRAARLPAASSTVALAGGCALGFDAERIDLTADLTGKPGIVYALPRSELEFSVPVTVTVTKGGELGELLIRQ